MDEACGFGWFDGEKSHVCRDLGNHDKHSCTYCGAVHDPDLKLQHREYVGIVVERTSVTPVPR